MSIPALGDTGQPGFYGKMPTKGDFVGRRLPAGFVDPWHRWLQAGLAHSRDVLGAGWLDAYMNFPVWRFFLSAGLCGDRAVAGVLLPSVDRVGRHFPFTLALPLPEGAGGADLPDAAAPWFDAAEEAALGCLDTGLDFESFERRIAAVGVPAVPAGVADGASLWWTAALVPAVHGCAGLPPPETFTAFLDGRGL